MNSVQIKRIRRQIRVRKKIRGTQEVPRLSVFRSNTSLYAQLIDDKKGETILGVSEKLLKDSKGTKAERAKMLGVLLAERAKEHKIESIVFDRGPYKYHGRVQAFAEGVKEGGLKF
ncbi:MAG: 50S ribosomal protein L18 [Candidatus Levybacteria bacterium]|nr:50S ribosomal protein L18 [Candidatus Levybacteria bacterium]